ncbi:hypothetical protein GCM10023194_06170 [Planotetraspora phitsanulokensis]|uniref:Uncharacterized protein n=1 Tax=Planotetraspora phitsanulokensis TaxID=575192 RepID=A0A8J3U5T3_9ACTN|nr:hypothetical protein [Planotetraspora phitsanulokensis]GII39113.1 hypothetical protein Pph01_41160 [Planotetraspora phitsanulokensis]
MDDWAKVIDSIAGLVDAIAWPLAVIVAVWLIMRRHRNAIERLIDRITKVGFPGGEIDLSGVIAGKEAQVEELEQEVVAPDRDEEERREAARRLAAEAEELGRIREIRTVYVDPSRLDALKTYRFLAALSQSSSDDPPAEAPVGKPS